ncbi:MAG: membrane protein insertase YidC [Bacteroidota bacterium]
MMDKNSITGLVMICGIMILWMWYAAPSKKEIEKQRRIKDSLELIEKQNAKDTVGKSRELSKAVGNDSIDKKQLTIDNEQLTNSDSVKTTELINKYDMFASAVVDSNKFFTIENEKIKITISNKGGRICSVQLKKYRTYDSLPLILFDNDSSSFGLLFDTENNRTINTAELYFEPLGNSFSVSGNETKKIAMRLYAENDIGQTTNSKLRYIEYEYSLHGNNYMMDCKLNIVGMENIIAKNLNEISLQWAMRTPSLEKDLKNQKDASTVYYKYLEEDPDYLSETTDETKPLNAKIKWVAFKQQFFTSVIIANDFFEKSNADITSHNEKNSKKYVKMFATNLAVPYNHQTQETFGMKYYFGPNHFQTLKKYNLHLEKQIPLGWGIFGWVNKFLVVPVFNFLDTFNLNYAIIILFLTLIFKTLLFPVAYKTYTSSAKMKILKPEIEEINKKFGKEDAMKKQQAMMSLYKKAGVNPLAGCIPALLQMPILFALFRFFPASIELRQHGFWWTTDLSTFDSVWDFGYIPIINFIYGDHVSVWALLCTITTLLYTHMNSQLMSNPGSEQMPGMKAMIYIMPVFFLPFLNQFSAGLSYYYTLANLISFGQMFLIKRFVDEKKLRAKIEEHKKKPIQQSSFQMRLQKKMESMQKRRRETHNKKK